MHLPFFPLLLIPSPFSYLLFTSFLLWKLLPRSNNEKQSLIPSQEEVAREYKETVDKLQHSLSFPFQAYAQLREGGTIRTVSQPERTINIAFGISASVDQLSLWQPFPSETSSSVLLSAACFSFYSNSFKTVTLRKGIREVWGKKEKRMI